MYHVAQVYSDWDWHQIELLLHGPLRQSARVIKLMSGTKWIKRQLSLLLPAILGDSTQRIHT